MSESGDKTVSDITRYLRRDFLSQCAAIPLVARLAPAAEPTARVEGPQTANPTKPIAPTGADTAEKLESLLQLLDPQLRYRHTPVADAENAWPMLTRARDLYAEQPDDSAFQEGIDKPFEGPNAIDAGVRQRIVDWVKQNSGCLRHVDAALERPSLELPRATASPRLSLAMDEIHLYRSIAKLKTAASRIHQFEHDTGAAIKDAESILTLGTMLLRAECLIVDYLVAIVILGMGVEATAQAATAAGATDDQAKKSIARLADAGANCDHLKQSLRVELCRWFLPYLAEFPDKPDPRSLAAKFYAPDSFDSKPTAAQVQASQEATEKLAIVLEGHPNPLDKKATTLLCSQIHVRCFASLGTPWPKRDRSVCAELEKELADWPEGLEQDVWLLAGIAPDPDRRTPTQEKLKQSAKTLRAIDNVLGKYMVWTSYSSTMTSPATELSQARLEAARLRIALTHCERSTGRLPSTLEALVERGYLPQVPIDPFDGDRFKFSPERRVIWSVGQKEENHGLVPENGEIDSYGASSLTWQIPGT